MKILINKFLFLMIALNSLSANAENYITADWCSANFGDKQEGHVLKQACSDLAFSKKVISTKQDVESFNLVSQTVVSNIKSLKRSFIMQSALTKHVGEKTVELINGYVDFLEYLSEAYGQMSLNSLSNGSLELSTELLSTHSFLSTQAQELKIP